MNVHDKLLGWLAAIGAAGTAELADALGATDASAAARLRALARVGLVRREQLLAAEPALWLITPAGLRAAGRADLGPVRVSGSSFRHQLECARTARALERAAAGAYTVHSERELRAWERAAGPLASAELAYGCWPDLHRPDLVLLRADRGLPVAIEVELTVKAPARLRAIVRAWARSRRVAQAVYYATEPAARALVRAVEAERAESQVTVLALAARTVSPLAASPHAAPARRSTNPGSSAA
ncbi:MAG TPA: hypothetical protein VL977_07270 [Solirubrobacteraceae bacterium]|nr:hypothetical protein [Solirubrobacteraceae bacterium]